VYPQITQIILRNLWILIRKIKLSDELIDRNNRQVVDRY